ncbi:YqaI family protein [Bacillus sp. FJAT-52991]|uniref:Halobacterial output domain-containing protein n=1 Tax=Bacillus kandeliae TaxID=3129297 RepID=A0ABZ2N2X3_9BACI
MRDHPMIEQIERTGYPAYLEEQVADTPIEDMFGDEILDNDIYFVFKNGDVVLSENLGHYAIVHLDADEVTAE